MNEANHNRLLKNEERDMETTNLPILVVDDNPDIVNVISTALKLEGYECQTASNGTEATEALSKQSFELVVTDIFMPENDGLYVINYIRKHNLQVKVIAITAGDETSENISHDRYLFLKSATRLGAVDVLKKPFEIDELVAKVKAAIEK
jgi:two-component system response regulator MprA